MAATASRSPIVCFFLPIQRRRAADQFIHSDRRRRLSQAVARIKDIRTLGRHTALSHVEVMCDSIDKLSDLSAIIALDLGRALLGIEASPPEVIGSN